MTYRDPSGGGYRDLNDIERQLEYAAQDYFGMAGIHTEFKSSDGVYYQARIRVAVTPLLDQEAGKQSFGDT